MTLKSKFLNNRSEALFTARGCNIEEVIFKTHFESIITRRHRPSGDNRGGKRIR